MKVNENERKIVYIKIFMLFENGVVSLTLYGSVENTDL